MNLLDESEKSTSERSNVPQLISQLSLNILSKNKHRLIQEFAEDVPSIVLFADLSGFSVAGAQLIRSSDRGAEELRDIINAMFERVGNAIQMHGGRTLQFSGDAVAAAWPLDGDLAEKTAQALSAGLAIQAACRQLTMGGSELKMRVAVARGSVWITHVLPTAESREIVVCGDVFAAFGGSGSGYKDGVLIASDVWADVSPSLAGRTTVRRDPDGLRVVATAESPSSPLMPSADITQTQAGAYIPVYLRNLLDETATGWLAEFRSSIILFAQFAGFAFSGPDDLPTLSALVTGVEQAIEGNGGTRLKLGTDDKGLILLAGWGLPSSSYENNAERALIAANTLREAAMAVGIGIGIGVTGGKVFAGLVGAQSHMEYTVIGDAVNRAAALSMLARGAILIDEDTRQASSRRFSFTEAGASKLKGQDAVASYYSVESEALGGVIHRGDLIGRASEKAAIEHLIAQLKTAAPPGVFHIVGDAGLGKSRLAAHFHDRLGQEQIGVYRLNADSLRRTTGFFPWRQIIAAVLGLKGGEKAEDIDILLNGLFREDPQSAELIPLLSPVLPFAIADTGFTASLFGGGRAEKTQTVIVALLQKLIGTGSQVLIVEDAHWFDSASWQLLERFVATFPKIPVVIVSRPLDRDLLPFEARLLLDRPDAMTIALMPFSRADSEALINATLGVIESAPAIVDLIYRNAEGHPLFTSALALSLRDKGFLRIEAGYARMRMGEKGLAQIAFPDGVEGVVAERIGSLTPSQQLTLKVAAVLGRAFDLDILLQLHPASTGRILITREIAAAQQAGLVETLDAAAGRYRFHHAIIGDTAYKLLVSEQRRKLHARTAEILDGRGALEGYPSGSLALLAHHFEQAERLEAAVDYLSRAADNARSGYNNVEVVDFLTRALKIVEKKPELASRVTRGNWAYSLAEALKALGYYQRAADFLTESATLLDRAPPSSARQAMIRVLGDYGRYRFRPDRAAQPAEIRVPALAAASTNMTLSEIHYELNKVPFSLAEVMRAVNLARQAGGDSPVLAKIYMGMALISSALPWALDGEDLQRRSIEIAERLKDPATLSWIYMASGVYETGKAGFHDGEAHFRRSMEVSTQCGERKNWETSMSSLGNLKRVAGLFVEAMACSDATLMAARDRDISHSIAWSHNGRLRDLLCLGRFEEAREDSRILNAILNDPAKKQETNDNSNLVDHYGRALLALVDGDNSGARTVLDGLVTVIRRIPRPQIYMVQTMSFASDVVWNLWNRTSDETLLGPSATIVKSGARMGKQYRAGKPAAELAAGDSAWYRGKKKEAVQRWLASAKAGGERGMRYNQAQALYRLDQTGQIPSCLAGPTWQTLIRDLGIERPAIWSLAT
ncbi:AAA family ATPase [Pararhizobium sp.]|uniref:AAA family ATPase n=1 Tax=Pararhizobium sp. TaxID=1977563 RepID=UPI00271E004A|nr:adenylate/guanylate cyclase domain-containing protein [Pararhizobium sp.]MDO9416701.1 adenylate/guanylate cyclase domain-containing protein [Pararhizobium sp.]